MNLTVVILTKNEENNIKECIRSILPLNCEILVLDDHSSDQTCEFARQLGARVEAVPDSISGFGMKRVYATSLASHDLIFHLDSDERVDDKLILELRQTLKEITTDTVVELPRLTFLFSKPVRHSGWYPDHKRRIYNRQHTNFSQALVHEDVILRQDSKILRLNNPILHYSYPTLESFFKKQAFYPVLWGQEKAKKHKRTSLISIPFRAVFFFFKTYILRLGFLDGKAGLWLAIANMSYECSKYLCLYEAQKKNGE